MKKILVIILLLSLSCYVYAADLTRGKTFSRNEQVNNTKLHQLVDDGTVNPSLISGKTDVTSTDSDYMLIWDATDSALKKVDMAEVRGAGTGAPTNADYLVGTANTTLTAEIAVGTTPGGQLGNTWASPTIDDLFIKNDASDTMNGTLTCNGVTMDANEEISLGGKKLDHDGTDFTFDDTLRASNIRGSKTLQFTIPEPDQMDASDLLAVWSNESAGTFTISSIKAWSDDPLGSITLHARDADGANNSQICDFSAETAGTGVYYGTLSSASDSTVTTTQVIYYDYTQNTPDYIKFTIIGGY